MSDLNWKPEPNSTLGPDWSSILPVLAYQYGELEDLGQIIDQKA